MPCWSDAEPASDLESLHAGVMGDAVRCVPISSLDASPVATRYLAGGLPNRQSSQQRLIIDSIELSDSTQKRSYPFTPEPSRGRPDISGEQCIPHLLVGDDLAFQSDLCEQKPCCFGPHPEILLILGVEGRVRRSLVIVSFSHLIPLPGFSEGLSLA